MQYEPPFRIVEAQVARAFEIAVNYFERKHGFVCHEEAVSIISEIESIRRSGVRHPLVLANKAIAVLERRAPEPRAA